MYDVLLGTYMSAVCSNKTYSNNGANACRLHYCMGVLNYALAPSPNRDPANRSACNIGLTVFAEVNVSLYHESHGKSSTQNFIASTP